MSSNSPLTLQAGFLLLDYCEQSSCSNLTPPPNYTGDYFYYWKYIIYFYNTLVLLLKRPY